MKRFSYRDRDYPFGQAMLTLRSTMGLTQAGLADLLGVSRRAVGAWESGSKYPKVEHLKQFITFAVEQRAFPAGSEAEAIRTLWQVARQKVLLDEHWLAALLSPASQHTDETGTDKRAPGAPRMDWGEALSVPTFYGRGRELTVLTEWVVQDRCRVVSVLGLGGIGKSSLVVHSMHQMAQEFEVVIWRSLRDAPTCEALIDQCLSVINPQALGQMPTIFERRLALLLEYMRSSRILLVLDNLESLLEEGEAAGRMRPGYANYGRLLRRIAETEHQSCLLLTSREKPDDLVPLEGNRSPVRVLRLARLDVDSCEHLLAEKDVVGSESDQARLIEAYTGNPLALKIVAQTIADLFDGAIGSFLEQGEVIFGGVRQLLSEQFTRLSPLERDVTVWLAILREPSTLDELGAVLVRPAVSIRLLEAMESLSRRSLIERGQARGSFTLQSVVLEYVMARLIGEASDEIEQGRWDRLAEYGIELAQSSEYVRQTQERMIVSPILARLQTVYARQSALEEHLQALLRGLSTQTKAAQGYAPANLVALLRLLRGDLRGLDLSRLVLRNVYLQGVEMQDTILSEALIQENVFTQTFDTVLAVDASQSGDYCAAASSHGEVMVWATNGLILENAWRAHNDMIWAVKFSPDGRFLATGAWDDTLRVWAIPTGKLLWEGKHKGAVNSVAFSPDGRFLASASDDATVALWDLETGARLQTLQHAAGVSGTGINWSPDGKLLMSGDLEGNIRLWEIPEAGAAQCVQTFRAHSTFVDGLALSPDGRILASSSIDGTVKLWDMVGGQLRLRQIIVGHLARIGRMAWSPDGRILACGGIDKMVWLFDIDAGHYRAALQGHRGGVNGLVFMLNGNSLLSGGGDSLHLWDISTGQCARVIEGYSNFLYTLDWSPDGTHLVGGSMDSVVTVWDLRDEVPPLLLYGHTGAVIGIAWSPDGRWIASSEWDNTIRLWNPLSGDCLQVLQHPDDAGSFFSGVAWNPDGTRLVCGTHRRGVQVFEIAAQNTPWVGSPFPTPILPVAWSPDGSQLAGGGTDGTVYMWDAGDGTLLRALTGHYSTTISTVVWCHDRPWLASGSRGKEGGELFVWDVQQGECVYRLAAHPGIVNALTWGSNEDIIITGSSDGFLRWWQMSSGKCLFVRQAQHGRIRAFRRSPDGTKLASCGDDGAVMLWDLKSGEHLQTLRRDRPYERLDITGIQGLTEPQKAVLRNLGAIEVNRS